MKIIRMYDKEERGEWQFAMVETQEFFLLKRKRRIGRRVRNFDVSYFRFMDNGNHTPGREAETLWGKNTEVLLTPEREFCKAAEAAYLTEK